MERFYYDKEGAKLLRYSCITRIVEIHKSLESNNFGLIATVMAKKSKLLDLWGQFFDCFLGEFCLGSENAQEFDHLSHSCAWPHQGIEGKIPGVPELENTKNVTLFNRQKHLGRKIPTFEPQTLAQAI